MTNLVFGGHFRFCPLTYLAHVEEMEVLWIMTQETLIQCSFTFPTTLYLHVKGDGFQCQLLS